MKENSIFITDDDGKEVEMKIYMTFDANEKQYVVVYEEGIEDKVMLLGTFLERVGNLSGVLDMEEYSEEGIYVFTPDDTN